MHRNDGNPCRLTWPGSNRRSRGGNSWRNRCSHSAQKPTRKLSSPRFWLWHNSKTWLVPKDAVQVFLPEQWSDELHFKRPRAPPWICWGRMPKLSHSLQTSSRQEQKSLEACNSHYHSGLGEVSWNLKIDSKYEANEWGHFQTWHIEEDHGLGP